MRKTTLLGNMAKRCQNNATRNAKKSAYILMWGEEPPKQKRRSSKKKDNW